MLLNQRGAQRRLWTSGAYELPSDAGKLVLIARSIVSAARDSPCAIVIHVHGVFPHTELPEVYERLRKSYGFSDTIKQKQCDVFGEAEADDALRFVGVAMLNGWDFWFMVPDDQLVVLCKSHDDIVSVDASDVLQKNALVAEWLRVGCNELSQNYLRQLAPSLFSD